MLPFPLHSLSFCWHFQKRLVKIDGFAGFTARVYIFSTFEFLGVSSGASAIVTAAGASPLFPCLPQVFLRVWKGNQARLRLPRIPLVSVPSRSLPVNEWAGHLTPGGSTSGPSDHQLLCSELRRAPVNPSMCFLVYYPDSWPQKFGMLIEFYVQIEKYECPRIYCRNKQFSVFSVFFSHSVPHNDFSTEISAFHFYLPLDRCAHVANSSICWITPLEIWVGFGNSRVYCALAYFVMKVPSLDLQLSCFFTFYPLCRIYENIFQPKWPGKKTLFAFTFTISPKIVPCRYSSLEPLRGGAVSWRTMIGGTALQP